MIVVQAVVALVIRATVPVDLEDRSCVVTVVADAWERQAEPVVECDEEPVS